ncbi:MAG: SMC-Scp complex subunit ScpB, partial [Candidatus Zixiibacteriota bacterium]
DLGRIVAELNERYANCASSYRLRELAGGYQLYIIPEFAGYIDELFTRRRKMRLTRAALETLAIIAYRQPVTRAGIEQIRGVASDGVIHNLLEKKMIAIRGRAESAGRPLQYGTADEFLKFFGLNKLGDLPKMSEIEELVRAADPESQPQLALMEAEQKLNIADGTYDPSDGEDDLAQKDSMSVKESGSPNGTADPDGSEENAETKAVAGAVEP